MTYSGTVSAAIEGTILSVPSFAISLAGTGRFIFDVATPSAIEVARYILETSLPYDTLLNVNVPNIAANAIKA